MGFRHMAGGGTAALVAAVVGLSGCSPQASQPAPQDEGPVVVASTTQTADFAQQVLGDRGKVVGLLQPNQSPHHHEVTPADVTNIAQADVVVHGGAGLTDAWLPQAVASAGFQGIQADAAAGAKLRKRVKDGKVEDDPHIWHDPDNAKVMTRNIAQAVEQQDPANKDFYERNASAYLAKLDELEQQTRRALDSIPADQRKIVTTHGAFGYYCDHYGVEFAGSVIPSFDDQAEQSSKQIDDFVRTLQESKVKAIFTEATIPADVVRAVGEQAHVKIVSDPLYSDNNGPGLDYIATETHNADVIVSNLR
ncbi:metal ABC transporter substrate-binding protein [Saccharopolyspora sp. 6V]|uniref:metal ABC transporter substrate-binding protein n=1 Tax=Saccharopolyspora sp. 6V TaxID=2877239 RepID=UPI001CD4C625|nr:metal ABC transporter substrate-binding protein [Saccharopolyspora sp. 6V]MCA1192853.1 metal ABC transporter substrate-binding protein [Saccharopolyspora sp. 6V]